MANLRCNKIAAFKARFHAPAADDHGAEGALLPGKAGLDVVVDPPTGMTVLIDGTSLGHISPLTARHLNPGDHTLHVRAMGYHSITLPVTLTQGQILRVPVALRVRPLQSFDPDNPPSRPSTASRPGAAGLEPDPRGGSASPPRPVPLPQGVTAVALHLVAQPSASILVDGEPSDGRTLRLRHGQGVLSVGELALTYTIGPGQAVDFLVPQDGCLWFRESVQLKAGSLVRLGRGLLRLRRTTQAGVDQSVILRRLA